MRRIGLVGNAYSIAKMNPVIYLLPLLQKHAYSCIASSHTPTSKLSLIIGRMLFDWVQ